MNAILLGGDFDHPFHVRSVNTGGWKRLVVGRRTAGQTVERIMLFFGASLLFASGHSIVRIELSSLVKSFNSSWRDSWQLPTMRQRQ